jgi:diaminopimelate decarboxylase
MILTYRTIRQIAEEYGPSFYILNPRKFRDNYQGLLLAFRSIYPNSYIAYSYKTNYIPTLCQLVDRLGGFAEVVSDMEYAIGLKVGVHPSRVLYNGPYKNVSTVEHLLLGAGTVNIDSGSDLQIVIDIARRHPDRALSVGIRCNFELQSGVVSRFGFDVDSEEFTSAIAAIRRIPNLRLNGLHCHFPMRNLETWQRRAEKMLMLVRKHFAKPPQFLSLGGGLYGKMPDSLKAQFRGDIPSYSDYAAVIATQFLHAFRGIAPEDSPMLILEPGTALVADTMQFVAPVVSIKDVRGKKLATLLASTQNMNPTPNRRNLPITVVYNEETKCVRHEYRDMDLCGYTCIEADYLYRGFNGRLAVGDYVVFDNVGSYSLVLKPPFILPNFAVVSYDDETGSVELVKERESFDNVFQTYRF